VEERVNQKIQHLSYLARQAYYERDYSRVAAYGNELANLSPRSEPAGLYFQALAISRQGQNSKVEAQKLYERLAYDAPSAVQSAAMLALGLNALQSNQLDEAKELLSESYRISVINHCAPITALQTQSALSALLSQQENHQESALILNNILPAIIDLGRTFPVLLGSELNNFAYELCQLGRLQEAGIVIGRVLSSPYVVKYPEWLETAREIDETHSRLQRNGSFVNVLPLKNYNVIELEIFKREYFAKHQDKYKNAAKPRFSSSNRYYINLSSKNNTFNLCALEINDTKESEERLLELTYLLNLLCTDDKTDYTVQSFISPDVSQMFQFEGNIQSQELSRLFRLIENVASHAKRNPLVKKPESLEQKAEIYNWPIQMTQMLQGDLR
jgi:hypothetical protein